MRLFCTTISKMLIQFDAVKKPFGKSSEKTLLFVRAIYLYQPLMLRWLVVKTND